MKRMYHHLRVSLASRSIGRIDLFLLLNSEKLLQSFIGVKRRELEREGEEERRRMKGKRRRKRRGRRSRERRGERDSDRKYEVMDYGSEDRLSPHRAS